MVESSSLEVQRRSRRAQTARLEVYTRLTLRQRQAAGERQGWSVVRVPSVDAEARRQLHRELRTAQRDRTRVIHRMQGLLAGLAEWQGSRSPAWTDPDPAVQKSIEVDLALIGHDDQLLRDVELSILTTAKQHHAQTLYLRRTVPGIGEILSLVLL